MTLDAQAEAALAMIESAIANGAPVMWELEPNAARQTYKLSASYGGPGPDVHLVHDITIPGPGGDLAARIYRPSDDASGALVYFHGGGFVIGDIDTHDRECRRMANRSGCVVISVDYRLAPEGRFPAAVEDAWASLSWVHDNADQLSIDPSRLAVGGDSAGGNLAAVCAIRARDESLPLAFQLLVYPAVDISEGNDDRYPSRRENDGKILSQDINEWFVNTHYIGADVIPDDPRLAPIRADSLAGLAPALVIVGGHDPLHDEGVAYVDAMNAAGSKATLLDFPGQIHGFFNMGPFIAEGWTAVDNAADAVAEALS